MNWFSSRPCLRARCRLAEILAWVCLSALGAEGASAQLQVTYLANEGFLLAGGGKKVLVDGLFAAGVRGYPTIPDSLYSAAVAAEPPFDGVDLVLASHFHADHFDAETVVRHLRANSKARFLSTPQAVSRIHEAAQEDKGISSRVEAAYPREGEALPLSRAGIELEVLNLHHGRGRQPPVENLGFVVRMGGLTWLHVGDTEATLEDFRANGLADKDIDVALLPEWFLDYEEFVEVIRTVIRPRHIVVMHLATRQAPASWFGEHGSYAKRRQAIRARFPKAVILEEPGDSVEFPRSP